MANYRNISITFWTDSKVDDDFTPEDKYFYLYLLTNPHTNICGCYEISMKQMERETGYNTDTIERLINRMQDIHGVVKYSKATKEILLLNWHKYNWSSSEKVKKAVAAVAEHIKNEEFKRYVFDMVSIGYTYSMQPSVTDTVSETETETVSETGTETETETVSEYRDSDSVPADKPQKPKRFTPPTVEDVENYCRERGNGVDAQRFVDYYTGNGWIVGRTPMKDWKAAVRTWERNGRQNTQPQQSRPAQSKSNPSSSITDEDMEALMRQIYAGGKP